MGKLLLPIPADPSLIYRVVVEQGDPRAEVYNTLYADLSTDPVSGCLVIDDPAIDNSLNRWLSYETSFGVRSRHPLYLAPDPGPSVAVEVYAIDAGEEAESGIEFVAKAERDFAGAGVKTVVTVGKVQTDASGYARISLPADSGVYTLSIGKARASINTVGRAGETVNFASLLAAAV